MRIAKKRAKFLTETIKRWEEDKVILPEQAVELRGTFVAISFDWKRLAKYSFWIAIVCIVIAVASALMDQALLALLKRIFTAPDIVKCLGFGLIAAALYYVGLKRRLKYPANIFSNEAVFFLGVMGTAGSIAFLGKAIDTGTGHFSLLVLLAALVYGLLGTLFPSKLIWLFSILSLGGWFGAETGYVSGWGAYFLGMNYPVRFVVFSLALLGLSYLLNNRARLRMFFKPTYIMGDV